MSMLVYGDPSYTVDGHTLLDAVQAAAGAAERTPSMDALRALLILSGQAEQAVADAAPDAAAVDLAQVTDAAAAAFVAAWVGDRGDTIARTLAEFAPALHRARSAVDARDTAAPLRVKIPEGFAFYTLTPEQYAVSALTWCAHRPTPQGTAAVIGIRSIGTTLSAVVAAALRRAGWRVHRTTVRPTGHPFDRRAALDPAVVRGAVWGLVVDEGPGLSGSSMAGAARALTGAGLPPDRIVFFPGHTGDPAGMAFDGDVARWWRQADRFVTPLTAMRWGGGRSLPEALAAETARRRGVKAGEVTMADAGGGQWRHFCYPHAAEWPPAYQPFERTKYICTLPDGEAVLWKFAGLHAQPDRDGALRTADAVVEAEWKRRAEAGFTSAPLGRAFGFVAVPWTEGSRLRAPDDASPAMLDHVGRYVATSAGPSLSVADQIAARERLREMLLANVREALGDAAAECAAAWSDAIAAHDPPIGERPAYGDGRLAPHDWLRRTPGGGIYKLNASPHDLDHTWIGRQTVEWDVAGVLMEWDLPAVGPGTDTLLAALRAGGIAPMPLARLAYYALCYAAFRLGMAVQCAQMGGDSDETGRLQRERDRFLAAIKPMLDRLPVATEWRRSH